VGGFPVLVYKDLGKAIEPSGNRTSCSKRALPMDNWYLAATVPLLRSIAIAKGGRVGQKSLMEMAPKLKRGKRLKVGECGNNRCCCVCVEELGTKGGCEDQSVLDTSAVVFGKAPRRNSLLMLLRLEIVFMVFMVYGGHEIGPILSDSQIRCYS
jgi:hypothetical protein